MLYAILILAIIAGSAVVGVTAARFLRARQGEAQPTYSAAAALASAPVAEAVSAIGAQIERAMADQRLQGETQRQLLAQKLDAVRHSVDSQETHVQGLRSELRHESRRRDDELAEIRHQIGAIQQTVGLPAASPPALPPAHALPPPADDPPALNHADDGDASSDDVSFEETDFFVAPPASLDADGAETVEEVGPAAPEPSADEEAHPSFFSETFAETFSEAFASSDPPQTEDLEAPPPADASEFVPVAEAPLASDPPAISQTDEPADGLAPADAATEPVAEDVAVEEPLVEETFVEEAFAGVDVSGQAATDWTGAEETVDAEAFDAVVFAEETFADRPLAGGPAAQAVADEPAPETTAEAAAESAAHEAPDEEDSARHASADVDPTETQAAEEPLAPAFTLSDDDLILMPSGAEAEDPFATAPLYDAPAQGDGATQDGALADVFEPWTPAQTAPAHEARPAAPEPPAADSQETAWITRAPAVASPDGFVGLPSAPPAEPDPASPTAAAAQPADFATLAPPSPAPSPATVSAPEPASEPDAIDRPAQPAGGERAAATQTERDAAEAPGTAEDLTVITTIDADMERALREAGVGSLEEIAHWGRGEARRIASRVAVSEETIMNQWVFEAQAALFSRYSQEAGA